MRLLPLAVLLAIFGCTGNSVVPIPPERSPNFTLPESTLATLARAVHDRNLAMYGQCFADTILEAREFHATFDSLDVDEYLQTHPAEPADWVRADEVAFFPDFIGPIHYDVTFTLDSDHGGILVIGGPSEMRIHHLRYRVIAFGKNVVAGRAALTFEKVGLGADVKLTRWEDHRDTTDGIQTWGMARLNAP